MDIEWEKRKNCCYASQRLAFSPTESETSPGEVHCLIPMCYRQIKILH